MKVIVYADFNCVYSYLASQRADRLTREGTAEVDWRGVEHLPRLSSLLWPADPINPHLASPDLPISLLNDPEPMRIIRRAGSYPLTATRHPRRHAPRRSAPAGPGR